jgi:Transposase DDE domain
MEMMCLGQNSYWCWAMALSAVTRCKVTKQAIFYRMTPAWVLTVKKMLGEVIGRQAQKQISKTVFAGFNQVWLQDSTCLKLPDILFKKFPGNRAHGKRHAVAKLNIIVNALTGICEHMQWDGYTTTEQSLSTVIAKIATRGDLIIRDMGYFVLSSFSKLNEEGINFLSKWKYGVMLFDSKTGEPIDLIKKLKNSQQIDIAVLCGKEEKVKCRLVAIKLSSEQTEQRVRRAKAEANVKTNHNKHYYTLLGYIIFITNVDSDTWSSTQVAEAYRVRWNIEILFKSWKSGLQIEKAIPDARNHTERVESILYLLLLYITWFQLLIYRPLQLYRSTGYKQLSIIQLTKWAYLNTINWLQNHFSEAIKKDILFYCCYDTRQNPNAIKHLQQFYKPLT